MIEIKNKQDCCGCTACASICPKCSISMKEDNEGFLYPEVNKSTCVNCGLCDKACPVLNPQKCENTNRKSYIVQNKDKNILRESTSGGAFTAIAEYVLRRNGVVFGATFNKSFKVEHTFIENIDDLKLFRNSKYVQSDINDSYTKAKLFLDEGRMVCFSGTPCQIQGLKLYLKKDYENLVTVDVVCRAVPSPGVWNDYFNYINKGHNIKRIRFRDKTLGYQYSTFEITKADGKKVRGGIESDKWLRMFFSGMIIRPSCASCKFRNISRVSDFTIWDCFNVYKYEANLNEKLGATRVVIHSDLGLNIYNEIKNNFIEYEISVNKCIEGVKELEKSPDLNVRREDFFKDYNDNRIEYCLKKYFSDTLKVKCKKITRLVLNRLGLDIILKHLLKKG